METAATYQQQAYHYIKNQIFKIGYKPGEIITDNQVARQLQISRTPVREAFHRLEQEGLLTYEARRGWKVYTLTLEDIQEIFALKEAIESMAARQAAECRDEKLRQQLRAALNKMQTAVETDDLEMWLNADAELHGTVFAMADNTRALNILNNLNDQWHRVRAGFVARTGRRGRSVREHTGFVEAILDGDPDLAETRMSEHLHRLRDELVSILVAMVLPFVDEGV